MKLVLASQSPRRRELLSLIQPDFEVCASSAEEIIPDGLQPSEAVMYLARIKAEQVAKTHADSVVIGADTVVVLDGQIMGKPKDHADCVRMISALSGREHEVLTGVAIVVDGRTESFYQRTTVRFLPLTEEEIQWYASLDEPYDKAGAYGIQDQAAIFVEAMDGDYYNVMGLPLCALVKCLRRRGVAVLGAVEP